MLREVKKFIRKNLFSPEHQLSWALLTRILLMMEKKHSRMSYAEIESMIGSQYRKMFGRTLNWDNPQTYNEKIHVSKLYMPTPLKTRLADKVAVREWITERIGSEYLVPLIGVYDSFDEIDFDALPDSFVIKCSHDSGSVTLVKDKRTISREILKLKYDFFMRRNYAWRGLEMHYRDIPHKIMIEQYMGDAVNDYKFLCFDGSPHYCWVDMDRFTHHTRNFYSLNWERQPFSLLYPNNNNDAECPAKFGEMKNIAEALCGIFPHVRVDLYFVKGNIYFGEMTFSSENGNGKFTPDEWDYKLGALWPFDNTVRSKVLAEYSRPADYQNP